MPPATAGIWIEKGLDHSVALHLYHSNAIFCSAFKAPGFILPTLQNRQKDDVGNTLCVSKSCAKKSPL